MIPAREILELKYGKALVEGRRQAGSVPVYGTNGRCGSHNEALFKGPGVVLGRKGQGPLGVEWCETDYWVIDTAYSLIPLRRDIDLKYAFYLIKHIGLNHLKDGTSNPTLSRDSFGAQALPVPPLVHQRAIAHILGTLDDKIELNRRMSETLEAMARALFKSWFVDFEPVRAKAEGRDPGLPEHLAKLFPDSFEESELGEIPAGWNVGTVADLCEAVSSGGTPSRSNAAYWVDGTIPWFKTGELLDGPLLHSEEHITEAALKNSSCKLWPSGTVLFALYAAPTVGRIGVLTEPGTSNQAAAGLIAKPSHGVPFLRRLLIVARARLHTIAVGAAQQNINQAVLKSHRIVMPANGLSGFYSLSMHPLDQRQTEIARESLTLTTLRDTLLPKLISGEIRVREAERFLERVGA